LKYFGKDTSIHPLNPEKLFHNLDIYEILAGLHPNIDSLYSDKDISRVRVNSDEVLRGLADSVRRTLHEFQNYIVTYMTRDSFANIPSEGIHPLTKYVLKYISTLADYSETLNFLLKDYDGEDPMLASPCKSSDVEEESGGTCDFSPIAHSFRSNASILKWLYSGSPMSSAMQEESISGDTSNFSPIALQLGSDASFLKWLSNCFLLSSATEEESINGGTCDISPVALYFRVVASILEYELYNRAKSFKDASLQHIFLMNNIHYVAEKVKNSKLQFILGEEWRREHTKKFQQLVLNYERITWNPIHNILNDEGSDSNFVSKALLRERLRSFYLAFEEVCRTQTTCSIPDTQLREDLRNSAPLKVIHAYKKFVELHANHVSSKLISSKLIKYSNLQNRLLHLFEGSKLG
jgi:exocyst complex protein 7